MTLLPLKLLLMAFQRLETITSRSPVITDGPYISGGPGAETVIVTLPARDDAHNKDLLPPPSPAISRFVPREHANAPTQVFYQFYLFAIRIWFEIGIRMDEEKTRFLFLFLRGRSEIFRLTDLCGQVADGRRTALAPPRALLDQQSRYVSPPTATCTHTELTPL